MDTLIDVEINPAKGFKAVRDCFYGDGLFSADIRKDGLVDILLKRHGRDIAAVLTAETGVDTQVDIIVS